MSPTHVLRLDVYNELDVSTIKTWRCAWYSGAPVTQAQVRAMLYGEPETFYPVENGGTWRSFMASKARRFTARAKAASTERNSSDRAGRGHAPQRCAHRPNDAGREVPAEGPQSHGDQKKHFPTGSREIVRGSALPRRQPRLSSAARERGVRVDRPSGYSRLSLRRRPRLSAARRLPRPDCRVPGQARRTAHSPVDHPASRARDRRQSCRLFGCFFPGQRRPQRTARPSSRYRNRRGCWPTTCRRHRGHPGGSPSPLA